MHEYEKEKNSMTKSTSPDKWQLFYPSGITGITCFGFQF